MAAEKRTQVVIAGAGAAGLLAAHAMSQAGLECVVAERRLRDRWGDTWCVEIDTHTILSQTIPAPLPHCVVHRGEDGADLFSPSGLRSFSITPFPIYMIRLWEYEKQLLAAVEAKSEVAFDTELVDFKPAERGPVSCTLRHDGATTHISCDLLVIATGLSPDLDAKLLERAGLDHPLEAVDIMSARQETWSVDAAAVSRSRLPVPPGVEAFLTSPAGPISTSAVWVDRSLTVGSILAGTMAQDGFESPDVVLRNVRDRFPVFRKRLSAGEARIPMRRPAPALAGRGIALIGHAACQAHPMTGSGVGLAGHAAQLLAEAAATYCRQGLRAESLWGYSVSYQRNMGLVQASAEVLARWLRRAGRDARLPELLMQEGIVLGTDMRRCVELKPGIPSPDEILGRLLPILGNGYRIPGLLDFGRRMAMTVALYRNLYPRSPDERAVRRFASWAHRLIQG